MYRSADGSVSGASAAENTRTLIPRRRSRRAAARPSAPLLPGPASTTTRRPYRPPITSTAARATAAPARSISTSVGSGAAASISAIRAGVTTGIIAQLKPVARAAIPEGHAAQYPQESSRDPAAGTTG